MGKRDKVEEKVNLLENLLEKFHIQVDDIRNYHILGVDPGAGEWSASMAELLGSDLDRVKDLYVQNDGRTCKDFSVLYYSENAKTWHIGEKAGKEAQNEEAVRGFFENFKVLPGSAYAMECYGHYFENPTMEELMVQNFRCIVKGLFVAGNNGLGEGKYIFFVGRPASRDWAEAELAYRDMLFQALEIEGVDKENVQIAMVSEAQASLAAEIYEKGLDLKSGRCQVVIDVGSSTLDAIVVRDGRVIGEYSRQIGAGCIEENMLELFLYDDCGLAEAEANHLEKFFSGDSQYLQIVSDRKKLREKLRETPYISGNSFGEFKFSRNRKFYEILDLPPALLRFELRIAKENFFGKNGDGGTKKGVQLMEVRGEDNYFTIDSRTMEKAIYHMPIFVPCTEHSEKDNPYKSAYLYRSYYDALAHFIDGVKEMHLVREPSPDVILTGGASVMPFVRQLIWKKLGVVPVNSDQPSYTVSRGLAYIGYAELKKQEEVAAINQLIDKTLTEKKGNLSYEIRSALSKWYMEEVMDDFLQWKDFGIGTSLEEALNKRRPYSSQEIGEMDLVKEWWTGQVQPEIVKEMKERFEALYKNANVQYDFKINPQIVENAYRVSGTTVINYSWGDLLGGLSAFWLNPLKTDYTFEQREKYYHKAVAHRSGMEEKVRELQSVRDLGDKHVAEILAGFREELYKDVLTYVEGLTPYIVRQ